MKIDLKELKKREGFINCQPHVNLPLLIWNYNQICQFDRAWDEYTKKTRGLITDLEGNIVANPFEKFFNVGETPETTFENIPTDCEITEKLDGSLGVQYYYNDRVCIATRGSFYSDQAMWATDWISKFKRSDFLDGYTYLWEIIYKENRIVINYGEREELVLLAVRNTETGEEIDHVKEANRLGVAYAKKVELNSHNISEIKISDKEEGYVIKFKNGLRAKIKGSEYIRLHKLITGVSSKTIWELLSNNSSFEDLLFHVPDEFMTWVKNKREELIKQFIELDNLAKICYNNVQDLETRKEKAEYIMSNFKEVASAVFSMLDGKNYEKIIWKSIKPKYQLPFKKDE